MNIDDYTSRSPLSGASFSATVRVTALPHTNHGEIESSLSRKRSCYQNSNSCTLKNKPESSYHCARFFDSNKSVSNKTLTSERTASTVSTRESVESLRSSEEPSLGRSDHAPQSKKLVRWQDMTSSHSPSKNEPRHSTAIDFEKLNFSDCLLSSRHRDTFLSPGSVSAPGSPCRVDHKLNKNGCSSSSGSTNSPKGCNTTKYSSLPAKKCKEMRRRMEKLEDHIQEAAKMELAYLNHAKDVRDKRKRVEQKYHAVAAASTEERLRELAEFMDVEQEQPTTAAASIVSYSSISIFQRQTQRQEQIKKLERAERLDLKKSKELHDKRYRWTQMYEVCRQEWMQHGGDMSILNRFMHQLPPVRPPSTMGGGSLSSSSTHSSNSSTGSNHSSNAHGHKKSSSELRGGESGGIITL